MINELNFQNTMNRMLNNINSEFDKRETSLIYQSVAMVVPELLVIRTDLALLEDEIFPDTCNYENLVRFAKLRGIEPKQATRGVVIGAFNRELEIGTRFNCENRNYTIYETATIDEAEENLKYYKLIAEETGHISSIGELTPILDIGGLTTAKIVKVDIDGTDEEEIESLRSRYLANLDYQAFGGNRQDYINKILSIENVGTCKLIRRKPAVSSEVGFIEVIIVDSTFKDAQSELIDAVQKELSPVGEDDGIGLVPIGHKVKVSGAGKEQININTKLTLTSQTGDILESVKKTIDEYLQELRYSFGDNSTIVVRISRIENKLLDISGVIDVSETTINGVGSNFTISERNIPILGDVNYERE